MALLNIQFTSQLSSCWSFCPLVISTNTSSCFLAVSANSCDSLRNDAKSISNWVKALRYSAEMWNISWSDCRLLSLCRASATNDWSLSTVSLCFDSTPFFLAYWPKNYVLRLMSLSSSAEADLVVCGWIGLALVVSVWRHGLLMYWMALQRFVIEYFLMYLCYRDIWDFRPG